MNLRFNTHLADSYKSNVQKARVLSEDWIAKNMFCPICGNPTLSHYKANKPVADFYCNHCHSDYELKSKRNKYGTLGTRITDGAYETMINRISSFNNPNFFFLSYNADSVINVLLIPNHFFTTDIIEQRKPLSQTARRAGWIGCNINIASIPDSGKIFIVRNGVEIDKQYVLENYKKVKSLQTKNLDNRGWLMDILTCIDEIQSNEFSLRQVYEFVDILKQKHPTNNNIEAKIRQQLQFLRDRNFIEFTERGKYRKL